MCIQSVLRTVNRYPAIQHGVVGVGIAATAYLSIPAAIVAGGLYGVAQYYSSLTKQFDGPKDVVEKAKSMGSTCEQVQLERAKAVMEIHDEIERIAYDAFADIVERLGIKGDAITEEQSGIILQYIKKQAHIEMYKKGGYIDTRGKLLGQDQIAGIMANVGKIIHDRDAKLTDARYHSLSELLLGLDDHNEFVKKILIQSWCKCAVTDPTHLDYIKAKAHFYPRMDRNTGINLGKACAARAAFWDQHFPGLREASMDASKRFVKILEVRNFLGGDAVSYDSTHRTLKFRSGYDARTIVLDPATLDKPFVSILGDYLITPRQVRNIVRGMDQAEESLVSDKDMTMRQFLKAYFPELPIA
ncbi:MAG: hypothetical protein K1X28_03615 [Parachlamydiales bacterium]|nr:hypothetical protein [Parachlamydiales bacterium]